MIQITCRARKFWLWAFFVLSLPSVAVSLAQEHPNYDHVVVVVEENHGYSDIFNSNSVAVDPYINSLASDGVVLTNAYGEQHPSQPNYYWLFSGSNQGITNDDPLTNDFGSNAPFNSPNLYTELQTNFSGTAQSNNFFGAYADKYPGASNAYVYQSTNDYVTRHVPWLGFNNINNGNPAGITQDFTNSPLNSSSQSYSANFSNLPVLSFVIPSLTNDMHFASNSVPGSANPSNGAYSDVAIQQGDQWLSNNLRGYASWAKTHNSLLIVTWDEDHSADWTTNSTNPYENPSGLTAPNLTNANATNAVPGQPTGPNQIPMIFYGANLSTNGFVGTSGANSNGVNNLNLYDTIQWLYGISNYGVQSDVAAAGGLTNAPITNIFAVPEPSCFMLLMLAVLVLPFLARVTKGGL